MQQQAIIVPTSAIASPTSTSRSYKANTPLQRPHHRAQPSDAFTSTNIPHHARKRTQEYQPQQQHDQNTPNHIAAVAVPYGSNMDNKAASPTSLSPDSGTICAAPIRIDVRHLTAIRQEKDWRGKNIISEKTILHNLSAQFEPGKLIGIMGGSGSGKTSLLNLLANRGGVRETFCCTGDILFNGRSGIDYGTEAATEMAHVGVGGNDTTTTDPTVEASTNSTRNIMLERRLGYVRQHDYLLPHVTVYETLMYAAQLRLSSSMSDEEKETRVEQILRELNLTPIRNSLIGDEKTKGISGGEKRRCSVAVQMLSDPSVLFLDEPTTGLDSYTAHHLITTLSNFAHTQNRTVIATIHQPRSSIFTQFDSLIIMVRGQVVFQGSPQECIEFLEQEGFPVPSEVNPADFMLDLVTIDGRNEQKGKGTVAASSGSEEDTTAHRERESLLRVRALKRGYESWKLIQQAKVRKEKHNYYLPSTQDIQADIVQATETASFSTQVKIILVRTFKSLLRDKTFLLAQLLTAVSVGLILGLIFYQPPSTLAGIHSRSAALWLISSLYYYLQMIYTIYHLSISIFPAADQEGEDGMYSPGAFLLGNHIAHQPFYVVFSCVYMILVYALVGLRVDDGGSHVFISFLCAVLQTNACVSISLFCVSLSRVFNDASMTANSLWTFFNLSGGFLVATASLPKYVKWIQAISYVHYGWRVMMVNEYTDRSFSCDPAEQIDGSCATFDGERILAEYSMHPNEYQTPFIGLVVIWASLTLVSYLLFVFSPSHPGSQAGSTAGGAGGEKTEKEKEKNKQKEKELDLDVCDEDELQQYPQQQEEHQVDIYQQPTTPTTSLPPPPPPPPLPMQVVTESTTTWNRVTSRGFRVSICEQYDPSIIEEAQQEEMQPVMRRLSTQAGKPEQQSIRPMLTITLKNITLKIPRKNGSMCVPGNENAATSSSSQSSSSSSQSSDSTHKILLHSLSNTIDPGKLVVMMGSSGAGKSTLLDILSHRSSLAEYMTGEVLFNDQVLSKDEWESVVGYVMQNDHLLPFLTVEETFNFAATLRLPPQTTPEERATRVTEVINELGLQRCRTTLIGSHEVKGISGGEIRRVSIGIQILTDPSILILDEPTSGLDTFTAFQLINTLRRIARKGRTVLCSLHQPRSDIYSLFDKILLLAPGGHLIFSGAREEVAGYFAQPSLNMRCDLHTNPADWLLDNTCLDFRTKEGERMTKERNERMVRVWNERNDNGADKLVVRTSSSASSALLIQPLNRASFSQAFSVLSRRSFLNLLRQPGLILSRAIQIVLVAIVLLLYYAPLHSDQESIQNRMGLIEEFSGLLFVGMLNNIAIYPSERNIFYREYSERSYGTLPFVLNYTIVEVVCELIGILFFSILVMYGCDMQSGAPNFFLLFYILFCYTNSGESFGLIFCSVVYEPGISVTIANAFLAMFAVMIGIFSLTLPAWLDGLNHLSILKFGTSVLGRKEFAETMFDCDPEQLINLGHGVTRCPIQTGDEVLSLYQFDKTTDVQDIMAVTALCIGYRLLAFWTVSRAAKKNHFAG